MKYCVRIKVTGRKGSVDIMAWDRWWHMANNDAFPFSGIEATWEWVN